MTTEWVQINVTAQLLPYDPSQVIGSYLDYRGTKIFDSQSGGYPFYWGGLTTYDVGIPSSFIEYYIKDIGTIGQAYTESQFSALLASNTIVQGHFAGPFLQTQLADLGPGAWPVNYYLGDPASISIPVSYLSPNDTFTYYTHIWAEINVVQANNLFTTGADTVNFNALTSDQQQAIANSADTTHGLGGNDFVTLPNSGTATFYTGSTIADNNYRVIGGNGTYNIFEGAGTEFITINGSGSSNITAGSGADTITISGNGDNNVTIGTGIDIVTISGTGNNTVTDGGADGVTITQFQGTLDGTDPANSDSVDITKPSSGNMIIGDQGTATLDALFTGSVTFSGIGGTLKIDPSVDPNKTFVINGFTSGDTILFANQKNLTLSAAFGQDPGEVDVYSLSTLIAAFDFTGTNAGTFVNTLEPYTDDAGTGTKVIVDPEQPVALSDSQGTSIIWKFIHDGEGGNLLSPYVPVPDTSVSGVTVGIGVDLANGLIHQQTYSSKGNSFPGFSTLFPDYASDPNLKFLFNATNPALIGFSATTYLNSGVVQTSYNKKGQTQIVKSVSVSITQSQANLLSNTSEQYHLTELNSVWAAKSSKPFTALPAQAQTILYDMAYQYNVDNLPTGKKTKQFFSDMLAAAQTISPQNPNGTPTSWVPVFNDLTLFGDNYASRRLSEAALILQIPGVVPAQLLPPVLEQGTVVASNENYNFVVTDTTTQYALDPGGSDVGVAAGAAVAAAEAGTQGVAAGSSATTYVLLANAGSPNFNSIELPLTTADLYAVSYEIASTWSQPQTVQPLQTLNLPANVIGLQVALEDSNGNPLPDPGNFTFYVTFASAGTFSGAVIDVPPTPNPPPPAGTTADMILRDGANGDFEIYNLGNNAILGAAFLGQVGNDWQFGGLGRFYGTDTSDMILRNSGTGAFELYDISNNDITNAAPLGTVGLEWQFGGFGDFSSRPAETDMILRNSSTAALEVYDISNNSLISAYPMGAVGLEWQVAGFGDFSSRPNETDMIMRNVNTGALEVYDIANNALMSAYSMGAVGLEWQVAGFGHFSSQADETDMIMRNSNTGAFEVYDIANNALTNAYSMGAVGLEWHVVGFGNFSGNANETDMILRNRNTGALEGYNIANNELTAAYPMGAVGLNWEVGGVAPESLSASTASLGDSSQVSQLVQAMAGFGGSGGAAENLNAGALGADTSQQSLLTTPHA
jgi:hypothetical protein